MNEKSTRKQRLDLPPENFHLYSIEYAAFWSQESVGTIRGMIDNGTLKEEEGHLVDHGTRENHHWRITRKGWKVITKQDVKDPKVDPVLIAEQVVKVVMNSMRVSA